MKVDKKESTMKSYGKSGWQWKEIIYKTDVVRVREHKSAEKNEKKQRTEKVVT